MIQRSDRRSLPPVQGVAWDGARRVGLGQAMAEGYWVVYEPPLPGCPSYQGQGIGRRIVA